MRTRLSFLQAAWRFELMERTTKRLEKMKILKDMIKDLETSELKGLVRLMSG
jgi:hypothetical protein